MAFARCDGTQKQLQIIQACTAIQAKGVPDIRVNMRINIFDAHL